MAKKRKKPTGPGQFRDWSTIQQRIAWLTATLFGDNRSAMAEALGLSHTAIIRVVAYDKPPGRKLLSMIIERLGVDGGWLLAGQGEPFVKAKKGATERRTPVFEELPTGPITGRSARSAERWLDGSVLLSPSCYWFRLGQAEPVLRETGLAFRVGDYLLFESDPSKFSREDDLWETLCAVRFARDPDSPPVAVLGHVSYHSVEYEGGDAVNPPRLDFDMFDAQPAGENLVRETVFRRYPDGKIRAFERQCKLTTFRGKEKVVPLNEEFSFGPDRTIEYSDIVAVWTGIIHRPGFGLADGGHPTR